MQYEPLILGFVDQIDYSTMDLPKNYFFRLLVQLLLDQICSLLTTSAAPPFLTTENSSGQLSHCCQYLSRKRKSVWGRRNGLLESFYLNRAHFKYIPEWCLICPHNPPDASHKTTLVFGQRQSKQLPRPLQRPRQRQRAKTPAQKISYLLLQQWQRQKRTGTQTGRKLCTLKEVCCGLFDLFC